MQEQQTSIKTGNILDKLMSAETIIKLIIYIVAGAVAYANMSNKIENHTNALNDIKVELKKINELDSKIEDLKVDISAIKQKQKDDDNANHK